MSQNSAEVNVGTTGSICSFPVNTVLQFGHNAPLPVTKKDHGFASSDGIKQSGSRSTNNIMAWQDATLVRTVVTEASVTYQFTLLQSNADNLELFYGTKKDLETGAYHWDASNSGGRKSFVIEVIDKVLDKKFRYYIPSGEVTEIGEITIGSGDAISYDITITAYKVPVSAGPDANTLIWDGPASEEYVPA